MFDHKRSFKDFSSWTNNQIECEECTMREKALNAFRKSLALRFLVLGPEPCRPSWQPKSLQPTPHCNQGAVETSIVIGLYHLSRLSAYSRTRLNSSDKQSRAHVKFALLLFFRIVLFFWGLCMKAEAWTCLLWSFHWRASFLRYMPCATCHLAIWPMINHAIRMPTSVSVAS